MSFPEFTAVARHIDRSNPDDRAQQAHNLRQLRELSDFLRGHVTPDVASCLDASTRLLEVLASPVDEIQCAPIKDALCTLLFLIDQHVEKPVRSDGEHEPAASDARDSDTNELATSVKPTPTPMKENDASEEPATKGASPEPLDPPSLLPSRGKDSDLASAATKVLGHSASSPASPLIADLPEVNAMVLGQILLELGHVTQSQVADALEMHRQVGLPLGECLVVLGATSPNRVLDALKIQESLVSMARKPSPERPTVDGEDGVARKTTGPAGGFQLAKESFCVSKHMFLGEVLLGSEMITTDQLEQAMHIHHNKGLRVGEALVMIGALSEKDVERGLELQHSLQQIAGLPGMDGRDMRSLASRI